MSSEALHEPREKLSNEVVDQHRAIVSIMEELEAVDWYNQRASGTEDETLRRLLEHNRDEEKEHAAMLIEWLRRSDPKIDEELRTYLFTEGDIIGVEAAATGDEGDGDEGDDDAGDGGADSAAAPASDGSLGIGSLKGE
jgi:ferritin-like protein